MVSLSGGRDGVSSIGGTGGGFKFDKLGSAAIRTRGMGLVCGMFLCEGEVIGSVPNGF